MMFKKRKEFPPGTFIPTPARILSIVQLCLAFSLILWQASQPFMGDLFRIKSQLLLYKHTMGIDNSQGMDLVSREKFERNAHRFIKLPKTLKDKILSKFGRLQDLLQTTFANKLKSVWQIFAFKLSSYELLWIILSILISILLLKRIEGAQHAVWLLPALAFLFLVDNQVNGKEDIPWDFYPSESEIVQFYLKEPLQSGISQQREQLKKGWELYLVKNWSHQEPSTDSQKYERQVEEGEFAFNVERLAKMPLPVNEFQAKVPFYIAICYVLWNLIFAYKVNNILNTKKNNNAILTI